MHLFESLGLPETAGAVRLTLAQYPILTARDSQSLCKIKIAIDTVLDELGVNDPEYVTTRTTPPPGDLGPHVEEKLSQSGAVPLTRKARNTVSETPKSTRSNNFAADIQGDRVERPSVQEPGDDPSPEDERGYTLHQMLEARGGVLRGLNVECIEKYLEETQRDPRGGCFVGRWYVRPDTPIKRSQVAAQIAITLVESRTWGTQMDNWRCAQTLEKLEALMKIVIRMERADMVPCCTMM